MQRNDDKSALFIYLFIYLFILLIYLFIYLVLSVKSLRQPLLNARSISTVFLQSWEYHFKTKAYPKTFINTGF